MPEIRRVLLSVLSLTRYVKGFSPLSYIPGCKRITVYRDQWSVTARPRMPTRFELVLGLTTVAVNATIGFLTLLTVVRAKPPIWIQLMVHPISWWYCHVLVSTSSESQGGKSTIVKVDRHEHEWTLVDVFGLLSLSGIIRFLQHTITEFNAKLAEISRLKKEADDRVVELEAELSRLAERCKELVTSSELSGEVRLSHFSPLYDCIILKHTCFTSILSAASFSTLHSLLEIAGI